MSETGAQLLAILSTTYNEEQIEWLLKFCNQCISSSFDLRPNLLISGIDNNEGMSHVTFAMQNSFCDRNMTTIASTSADMFDDNSDGHNDDHDNSDDDDMPPLRSEWSPS